MIFGKYKNGEPIVWLEMERKENRIILLAEKSVFTHPYYCRMEHRDRVYDWEHSDLHNKLNSSFREEYGLIEEDVTIEEITIPSASDIIAWFPERASRVCYPSRNALEQGAVQFLESKNATVYWLKDIGRRKGLSASVVLANGNVYRSADMQANNVSVRPMLVLHMKLHI